VVSGKLKEDTGALYQAYRTWYAEQEFGERDDPELKPNMFGRRLGDMGFGRDSHGHSRIGLRLRTPLGDEADAEREAEFAGRTP
jgi:hypothetical protein